MSNMKIKLINPKYKVDLFRDSEDGSFYFNNGNEYFLKNGTVAGIHIFDLLNDEIYKSFEILGIYNQVEMPKDLFIYFYDEKSLMKSYYQGHKSGIGSEHSMNFNKFLETI
jgi:hypothetical protein